MNATPIYDQMQREARSARVNESLDTADAHTLRSMVGVMCA
ncbi:hypothetical protein [Arthrobacter sp. PsM3]|nr:hypothetical protein [Arthrobacter sp. PsM3]MDN4644972.1 hypothetical protein [Arthrobacter sp. PsM3]